MLAPNPTGGTLGPSLFTAIRTNSSSGLKTGIERGRVERSPSARRRGSEAEARILKARGATDCQGRPMTC